MSRHATPFPHLLAPLRAGPFTLKNRVLMGSMHTRLEHYPDAEARLAAFYEARAAGGVAMMVTGGVAPNPEGLMEPGAPILRTAQDAAIWRPVVRAVQRHGCRILLQILHAGRYAKLDGAVGASAIPSPINNRAILPLDAAGIARTIADFATCAGLAMEAGFDGVEVMGSEGYLLNQFTAARTNTRTDDWGGSLEKRHRLPVAVVQAVRAAIGPERLLQYRISALDLVEGGATGEEIDTLARALQAAGVDIFNTGIGWHEARVPTIAATVPRGAWRFAAARLKRAVTVPVIGANRINTPELAEQMVAGGEVDAVSLARPLLADPDFVRKAAAGDGAAINTCIACNQGCLDYIFSDRAATCLVNPRAGRETEFSSAPALLPRRIAVVGAGAAGLSCATAAAARGHAVTLFEAADRVGGQMHLAAAVPGKQEFREAIRYLEAEARRLGVVLRLRSMPDATALADFDSVVLATGAAGRRPDIPGIDHPKVVTYAAILSGAVQAGRRVAVVGAGGIGMDVAHALTARPAAFAAEWGVDASLSAPGGLAAPQPEGGARQVTVLQRGQGRPGARLGISTAWILRAQLKAAGVRFLSGCRYVGISDAGLHVVLNGEAMVVEADTIVVCAGQEPVRALLAPLAAAGMAVHVIGGAERAEELDALRAIDQGMRLAQAL